MYTYIRIYIHACKRICAFLCTCPCHAPAQHACIVRRAMTRAQRVCGSTHQANTRSVIRIALRRVPVNAHVEFEIAMRAFGLVHELDGCSGNGAQRGTRGARPSGGYGYNAVVRAGEAPQAEEERARASRRVVHRCVTHARAPACAHFRVLAWRACRREALAADPHEGLGFSIWVCHGVVFRV